MNRLMILTFTALASCTISVTPIKDKPRTYWHKQQQGSHGVTPKARPGPSPSVTPIIKQLHEQYKPIYEKLSPTPKPEAPRSQIAPDSGP